MCNLINTHTHTHTHTHTQHREPLFATPCCNTSRATCSTLSEPPHRKPFFEVLSFSAVFGTGCCCQLVCFEFGVLHSVCPCIPETGRLENTYSCCGFWLWSWLAAVVNLFVLNLVCFIPFAPVYPKRAGWRTRTLAVVFGFGPGWPMLSACLF